MMKRTVLLLITAVLAMCSLTACDTQSNKTDTAAIEMSNFKTIDGQDYLSYNLDTRVVYYMFSTYETAGYSGFGYSYFAPYVNENGKFCRYINDEIVEIDVVEETE